METDTHTHTCRVDHCLRIIIGRVYAVFTKFRVQHKKLCRPLLSKSVGTSRYAHHFIWTERVGGWLWLIWSRFDVLLCRHSGERKWVCACASVCKCACDVPFTIDCDAASGVCDIFQLLYEQKIMQCAPAYIHYTRQFPLNWLLGLRSIGLCVLFAHGPFYRSSCMPHGSF